MEKMSQALEVKEMIDTLKTPIGGGLAAVPEAPSAPSAPSAAATTAVAISTNPEKKSELSIGMPTF
jgi:hypothetical protein